jgi:hypothetical protein
MTTTRSEQALLTRDHRRRRWTIRISLVLLLLLIILVVGTLILTSSSTLTPDEANAICATFHEKITRTEVEHLLGKPTREVMQNGVVTLSWRVISQSFNEIEVFECTMSCRGDGTVESKGGMRCQFVGWSAWQMRWWLIKERLGIK